MSGRWASWLKKKSSRSAPASLRAGGDAPDPRDAQIARLKAVGDELRRKLADRDAAIRDLEQFRGMALSRLAAQRDEITRLRRQAAPAMAGKVRSLTPRLTSQEAP